jgi:hypothetical protein
MKSETGQQARTVCDTGTCGHPDCYGSRNYTQRNVSEQPQETAGEPREWYDTVTAGGHQGLIIDERTGRTVAATYDKDDAPLITAAVSSHAEMIAALEQVRNVLYPDDAATTKAIEMVDAALAKARQQ